jgi:hypothetical protein
MGNYQIRLRLIQAKCELLLNEHKRCSGRPWHQDVKSSLAEIASEAQKAYEEVANDHGWEAGDR